MKNLILTLFLFTNCFLFSSFGQANTGISKENTPKTVTAEKLHIDSNVILIFFKTYPNLKNYQSEVEIIYKDRNYSSIWHDGDRVNELGGLLYTRINKLETEGIESKLPYKNDVDQIFDVEPAKKISKTDAELLLSSMYVFYASKTYMGIDAEKVKDLGWYLPKKKVSYEKILDSLLADPAMIDENKMALFSQYYKLQNSLKHYLELEKTENLANITVSPDFKLLKPDSTGATVAQIRHRLFVLGDLKNDSKSDIYDEELMTGVLNFKKRYGLKLNYFIEPAHIELLNKSISDLIKVIMVNMERCRWIDPELEKAKKYIMVNIPSFHLFYIKDGKYRLASNVFVGAQMTKTVIFSSTMNRIVFSPYWNVPQSIAQYDLKNKIKDDKDYLAKHNMEMVGGRVRQKPGSDNSLGLVKFMFPNENDIYLHDTPAKSYFNYEERTFSHGCINIQKARELALALLEDDPDWPVSKIDEAMSGKKETTCMLKEKIPIHIGYFTSWVQDNGEINFFPDVYFRDERLHEMLYPIKQ